MRLEPCIRKARLGTALLAAAVLSLGCGGGPPRPGVEADGAPPRALWPADGGGATTRRDGCGALAGPALPGAALVVAVTETVDPDHAPEPCNAAERLVFAQLYETLARVDCDGAVQPGLASHWSCTADSTVWIFAIRDGARFWDGTTVTAGDVRRCWQDRAPDPNVPAMPPFTWLKAGDGSVEVLDARRLKVVLPESQADLPRLLAHPATAVAARRDGWTWPVGSGPARLRAATPAPLPDLVCQPNPHHPEAPAWSSLTFQARPGVDPRDLAPVDFDLALIRSREAAAFYRTLPGCTVSALPWDRLYLLLCPPEAEDGAAPWLAAARRLDPAADLTLSEARAWPGLVLPAGRHGPCPQLTGPISYDPPLRRDSDLAQVRLDGATVIYPGSDPAAREMAGRLVALAGAPTRAVPLESTSVLLALRWQMSGAVVLPVPVEFPGPCLQLGALLARAAWLQQAATATADDDPAADPQAALLASGLARPLALTRPWLVTRGDLAGLAYDYDGTPRLARCGPADGPGESP